MTFPGLILFYGAARFRAFRRIGWHSTTVPGIETELTEVPFPEEVRRVGWFRVIDLDTGLQVPKTQAIDFDAGLVRVVVLDGNGKIFVDPFTKRYLIEWRRHRVKIEPLDATR